MEEGAGDPVTERIRKWMSYSKPLQRYVVCYIEKGRTEQPSWLHSLSRLYTDRAEAEQAAEGLAEKHRDDLLLVVPVLLSPEPEQAILPGHQAAKLKREEAARQQWEEAHGTEPGQSSDEPGGSSSASAAPEPAGPDTPEPAGTPGPGDL